MGESTQITKEAFFAELRALSDAERYAELEAYAAEHQERILPLCTRAEADEYNARWSHATMCAAVA